METVLVEYNPRNTKHLRIIQMLEAFGLIKKNPNREIYDRSFVEKIKEGEKQISQGRSKAIKTENLWT